VGQDRVRVGQSLRETRRHAGLTQMELARHLGVTQSTVSRVERGAIDPSSTYLEWSQQAKKNLTKPNEICMGENKANT
jgi:transcriptional regulator with XRE-family HTH domain